MPKAPRARRRAAEKPKPPKVRPVAAGALQPTAWERLSPRARHAVVLGFLLLVALVFFWPVTFGGYVLIGGDIVQWRGMAQAMFEYEAESGRRALWAPNPFGGMPGYLIHYPRVVPQLDNLPAALRLLGWWPGAHFFVLLLGTYLLVWTLSRDALASALAAVAYGLTTYVPVILTAGHNTKFVAMAFAPWLLLAYVYAVRRPPNAGGIRLALGALAFAVALAVNLRAEHVQITYYVCMGLLVLWVVEGIGAVREGAWRPFLASTAALALGGGLAVAMVAHPYLPLAEYRAHTIRAVGESGGLEWTYAMAWSQGVGELLTLLIPNAYGSDGMTYWGPKPFTAGPHYVGPIVLLLAGLAIYGVGRRVMTGLALALGLMVLFSLGEHFPALNRTMFLYFPLFSSFRVPETWLAAAALVLAVLAGAGAYYLGRREATPEAEARKRRAVLVGLGIVAGVLGVLLLGRDVFLPFEAPGEAERLRLAIAQQAGVPADDPRVAQAATGFLAELRDERRAMFTGDALRALVFVILAGALLLLHRARRLPAWALQAGLVLLVTIDLGQVGTRYFHADHPALRPAAQAERVVPEYGVDRYIRARVEEAGGSGHFRTLPLALNPFNDGRTPYFYESVGGYHGAKLAVFQDYIDHLVTLPDGRLNPTALDLMSTRFVIATAPIEGMEVVYEDAQTGLLVLERPNVLPRAFLVDSARVVPSREETLRLLQDPTFDLRAVVLLAQEPDPPPDRPQPPPVLAPADTLALAPADTLTAGVRLVRHTPREVVWEVSTDRDRWLVASEVYYPAGWTAQIGTEPVPIHQANHLLRAVRVPAGEHLVTMRFAPETDRLSIRIAAVATAGVYLAALLLLGLWWYRRAAPARP